MGRNAQKEESREPGGPRPPVAEEEPPRRAPPGASPVPVLRRGVQRDGDSRASAAVPEKGPSGGMSRSPILLALLLVSCGHGPKRISGDTYEALSRAAGALRRTNEYRDEPRAFYEPRYLEAERAVSEIPVSNGIFKRDQDSFAMMAAHSCLFTFQGYRSTLELVRLTGDRVDRSDRGALGDYKKARSERIEAGHRIDKCIAGVAEYLE